MTFSFVDMRHLAGSLIGALVASIFAISAATSLPIA